jgi:CIC family chloride channel protein
VVRENFGFSFSTWRFHMRGETIRSAHDIGRIRSLTAGRMMRQNPPSIPAQASVGEFRRRFPLGSTSRAVLLDDLGRYAGIVLAADAYAENREADTPLSTLATRQDIALKPETNVREAMAAFEASGGDELVVTDEDGSVLGLVTEKYAARRYAEELEKTRQDLVGES